MEPIEIIRIINFTLAALFVICYAYQFVYLAIPFLKKDKPHRPAVLHRYAVLISARNEQNVIGHLLDSINAQDYPIFMLSTCFYTAIGLASALVIDISYGFIDPRIRMGSKK